VAACPAQQADPALTLQRTRERLLEELKSLPRYTCVQAIYRQYFRAYRQRESSCVTLIAEHADRTRELPLEGWDRLRLDVAIIEGKTVYAWPDASRFEPGEFEKLAGRGPLGSGDFGSFIGEIFSRGIVSFTREEVADGRRLLAYTYRMPPDRSKYGVESGREWIIVAYSGDFRLDPERHDIVSLTVSTAEMPDGNSACQATSEIDFTRTSIHGQELLIPRETRLRTILRSGAEALSRTTYAGCRQYGGKTRILTEEPDSQQPPGAPDRSKTPVPDLLPPGLRFDIRITTPIDSDTSAAGDPVEAVLRSPLRGANKKMLAPAGARLRGRLHRVEMNGSRRDDFFLISVQFESIEIDGRNVPLRATTYPIQYAPGVYVRGPSRFKNGVEDDVAEGIGTLIFYQKNLHLKQHDSAWITLPPASEISETSSQ
jgi:hypothetical protein